MKLQQLKLWFLNYKKQCLLLIGVASISGIIGNYVGNFYTHRQVGFLSQQLHKVQQQLQKVEAELAEQQKSADYLTAELAVERSTSQLQLQDLKAEQQKLFETRKELAFYQKIISPERQANSLIIDSFSVSAGNAVGRYQFNLVLIEQDKQKKFAKGQISLTLVGKKQGKAAQVDLLQLAGFSKADRRFSFKHFQIFEGDFVLPSGFQASQVEVVIQVPASAGQKAAKVSRSIAWLESSSDVIHE